MIKKSGQNTTNYVLINLLESLNKQELKRFDLFVSSAYFNKDKQVLTLWESLQRYVIGKNAFDERIQTKIFLLVFKFKLTKGTLIDKSQKKLLWVKMSQLSKLAKAFIVIEGLEQKPAFKTAILTKQFLEKKQFSFLQQILKKEQKKIATESAKTVNTYAHSFHVENGRMNLLHQTGLLLKEDNFIEVNQNLDFYYLINKLKIWATIQSMQNIRIDKSYDFSSMEAINHLLNLSPYKENSLIILFKGVIKLLKNHKEEDFHDLLKLFSIHTHRIPKVYFIDFYMVACNFCAGQFRAGKTQYNQEILALYKRMDEQDLLKKNDFIEENTLKNIITAGCYAEEFEWATLMVNKYNTAVRKTIRESVFNFNLGVITFYQGQYKEAISYLIRVDKVNLVYDLDSRILLLKAYYQMDELYDERTVQIFRATERVVINKSIPAAHKKSYTNFIQILINLYRIRHQKGKKTLESVENKMAQMNSIVAKKWLLEKIAKIK